MTAQTTLFPEQQDARAPNDDQRSSLALTPGSAAVHHTLELLDAYIAHRAVKTETDAEHAEWLNHAVLLWQRIVASRTASE